MAKIAQTLYASTFLNMQLQGAFIDAFDLLRDPRLDRVFAARIDIGVEPTDLMAFMKIYNGGPPAEKAEGMVQVNAFTPDPTHGLQSKRHKSGAVPERARRPPGSRPPPSASLCSPRPTLSCRYSP